MPKPFRRKTSSKSPASNPNAMMAQVQQMQAEMAKTQEDLAHEYITVTAGGGAITVEISGQQRIRAIEIDPDLFDSEETDMLQDLLVAAVNSAIEQSQAMAAQRMEAVSASVPGLGDMLGGMGL